MLSDDVLDKLNSIDNLLINIFAVLKLSVTFAFVFLVVYFIVKFFMNMYR